MRMRAQGYNDSTIQNYTKFLKLLRKQGENLEDPESIKATIAEQESWNNSTKCLAVAAYTYYCSI